MTSRLHQLTWSSTNFTCAKYLLRQFNLTINPAKCSFGKKSIDFLGHHIDSNGIKPLPEKVKAVSDFPLPKDDTCQMLFNIRHR